MKLAAPILGLALTACTVTTTAELPAPPPGALAAHNVASFPVLAAELFDFPSGSLAWRASLVSMDDAATCFDALIRRPLLMPDDHESLVLQLAVEIDGVEAARREQTPPVCAPDLGCLPTDSSLAAFAAEPDARIRVEGQRVCFAKLPRARRELVLALAVKSTKPARVAMRFRFRFTGEQR